MQKGFFSAGSFAGSKDLTTPQCGRCGLSRACNSPKMEVTGQGRRRVLIVAEAPGKTEDEQGVQLIGRAGQLLRSHLSNCGIDLDRDCWKTNAIICRPLNNETPSNEQIDCCRPNLTKTIRELKPAVVIPLGITSIKSIMPLAGWKGQVGAMGQWVGWRIPSQVLNAWICPTWHPSYLLRSERDKALKIWFVRHLRAAVKIKGLPWPGGAPNHVGHVVTLTNHREAAEVLAGRPKGKATAWDLETDRLKPDRPESRVVSGSVCWGDTAYAFPWCGRVVKEMERFLTGSTPKIGWNIKFEDRWVRKLLGVEVRNWAWDGMLASHVLDHRPHVTGLKFQAFVRLGQPSYDDGVHPFLQADGANNPNRIKQVDLGELLLYNGMDSLLTRMIAVQQRREMQ